MSRKKPTAKAEFSAYNIVYEDGSQTSNRRMPVTEICQFEPDASIRAFFEAQDRDIGEKSGRPRSKISSIEVASAR